MVSFLYKQLMALSAPFLRLLLFIRVLRGKEDSARLNERCGIAGKPRPAGTLFWLHAASVGEAQSALILIEELGKKNPGIFVLVTTGTRTSATLMERRLPPFAIHQYVPLDHPRWIAAFLEHWQPGRVFWMESELWPNMLCALKTRYVPVILVNARLSEKSFSRWKLAPNFAREIIQSFSLILAQNPVDAGRFSALGARTVQTTGNLKFSASPLPHDPAALAALRLACEGRPLWVYASTHDGEEQLACRIHKQLKERFSNLLTIVVPRHPERREQIAGTCFEHGVKFRLRSHNLDLPTPDDDVYIADTLGELGLFYTLSDIAMIGRSFSRDGGGGHNPIEAAQLDCVVLTGPNNQFQKGIYADMRASGVVIEALDEDELYDALHRLLSDESLRTVIKEKTKAYIEQKTGVVEKVMAAIEPSTKVERRNAA